LSGRYANGADSGQPAAVVLSRENGGSTSAPQPPEVDVLVDSERFKNIYWAASVSGDESFQSDIKSMISYSGQHGISDLDELDRLAGETGTPVYLTNKWNGKLNPSMATVGFMTDQGPVLMLSINTRSGLMTMEGGRQSPTTGFIHEVGHGINLLRGPGVAGLVAMSKEQLRTWRINDDRAVIQGPESRAAKLFGEDLRSSHEAKAHFKAKCATCTR
jgi:hypothetical protein